MISDARVAAFLPTKKLSELIDEIQNTIEMDNELGNNLDQLIAQISK